ncbi:MAG: gliding motility-associated C-terminal domain-containing protein [Bacteroidetes bacterium]|nr:gliding motility-associated C-terminal domain-containing protein [Bacteroidota bacterium]
MKSGLRFAIFCLHFLTYTLSFSQGTWISKASLPAAGRATAVAFSIGNKGYIGTGHANIPPSTTLFDDFWEYDPVSDTWTQKANFLGGLRSYAVGFSIGSKGYLGTGNSAAGYTNDFWQYDPAVNAWIQMANIGGLARGAACGFSIGGYGYIGTGRDGSVYMQDFWKYDTLNNSWTQLGDFIGGLRSDIDRATFVIGNKAYWGTGYDGTLEYNDFWEYNPVSDTWTQKANMAGAVRHGATGFSVCGKGYLGLGFGNGNGPMWKNDFWMYNPLNNSWSAAASLPALGRMDQPSFVINDKAYIGTGWLSPTNDQYLNDFWELTPDAVANFIVTANSSTMCPGQSSTLIANGALTYVWDAGGQTTSSITVNPTTTTTYTVSGTDACGSSISTVTVNVILAVNAFVSGSTTICSGKAATLTASGGNNYSWSNGATTAYVNVVPAATTTYSVIAFIGSCSDTTSTAVTVNPLPTPTITGNTSVCFGDSTLLTASGGVSYLWNTGITTTSVNVFPTSNTTYTANVTDTNGCIGKGNVNVVVNPLPVATASGDTICFGQTATLTASGGGYYLWNTGETSNLISVFPTTTTGYTVVVMSVNGCVDTTTATATVNSTPNATINPNSTICAGTVATLTANGAVNYLWNTGAITSSIQVTPNASANYSVVVANGNCTDTASTFVTVNDNPTASVSGSINIFQGQSTTLNANGGANYLWSNGETSSVISVTPFETRGYCVTVTSTANCTDVMCATVTVESPCDTAGAFFFPNAFSPNGDEENDSLRIYYGNMSCIESLQLIIYDRWGEMIFETTDPDFSWDGSYKGSILETSVVAYHLTVGFTDGKDINRKGNISLLK